VIELGQFCGPARSGSNKRDFDLVALTFALLGKSQRVKTRAAASSVADCGPAITIIEVFMTWLIWLGFPAYRLWLDRPSLALPTDR
jgi:hypothetical protein